ncbi:diaminopropionate ammonia-lyase [Rhizobium tibeticum]|uniref:diaminopropionate ammonia-lyase n=1 Tax=Rhizobium tibeticum TaxID=501024 RepID=UPI0027823A56|nr:diaminopropionate ammonia-lyase [Rhizobium tibeticum]MDP9811499.1 diaminopropionate ammonia-lyase [Rhizobium tibeticum]
MFLSNTTDHYRQALDQRDVEMLDSAAARQVEHYLSFRDNHCETPLWSLPGLAAELGVASIHIKDEGHRLGLGSFKALGGAYAVIRLVLEEAERRFGRALGMANFQSPEVRAVAETMTVACATDGNHGRSVAQGAALVGARAAIFVHSGVSDERIAAISRFGAEIIRVQATYDDSVKEAARVAEANGWTIVSDTSWPGYERIPGLVMQGYTALVSEALRQMPEVPTHVFIQSGVGGIAATVAGHLAIEFGNARPIFTVVDPERAACLLETARTGTPVVIAHGLPTIMAMLECYEPSLVAWRVLSRVADGFMTVDEADAVYVMNRLANPVCGDPAIVAGESGGVGLAGLLKAVADPSIKAALSLDRHSRIFLVNTEGATDPGKYEEIVGLAPSDVAAKNAAGDHL